MPRPGSQLALEHTGDLYSCDHYVEPGYLLGNIKDKHMLELIVLPQQRKSGRDKRDTLTRYCRDCDVRFAPAAAAANGSTATAPNQPAERQPMSWGFIFWLRQDHSAPMLIADIGHPCRFRTTAAL